LKEERLHSKIFSHIIISQSQS